MKWFKDKYTISLNEVSLLFERGDLSILKRVRWVPARLLRGHYERFALEFSELFNQEIVNALFTDDLMRVKIMNRANIFLPSLYHALWFIDFGQVKNDNARYYLDLYREMYGRDYQGLKDLEPILNEIKRLHGKYKELASPEKVIENKGKMSFEQVITMVEMILERSINREMKLYQFVYQYDLAIKRAKAMKSKDL